MSANIYCAPNDIYDIMSQASVTLHTDDSPPTTLGGAAAKAGNRIDFYCWRRYDPVDLATSDIVKDWAAAIAAFFVSIRRGNTPPAGAAILYEAALSDLIEIKKGLSDIPGIPLRKMYVPVLSVMRATLRPYPRAVVEASRSSTAGGKAANYHQYRDPWEKFGLNTAEILDTSI